MQCHTCAGFGAQLRPRHHAISSPVLLSLSAFEPPWYLRALLLNALSLTANDTIIVLHLSAATEYPLPGVDADFDWIFNQPRVEVNCERVSVKRSHGSILQSQLANLEWARCRLIRPAHVVFQASNQWWIRRGMEMHVMGSYHRSSTPLLSHDADCDRLHLLAEHGGCLPLAEAHKRLAATRKNVSELRSAVPCIHAACDEGMTATRLAKREPNPCYMPPFEHIRFVSQGKHEGSFYLAEDAYNAAHAVRSYLAKRARRNLTSSQSSMQWITHGWPDSLLEPNLCQSQEPHFKRSPMTEDVWSTAFYLEEIFFQTWAANFGRGPATQPSVVGSRAELASRNSMEQGEEPLHVATVMCQWMPVDNETDLCNRELPPGKFSVKIPGKLVRSGSEGRRIRDALATCT